MPERGNLTELRDCESSLFIQLTFHTLETLSILSQEYCFEL